MRSLIEDIRDVRLHKVETNLEKFSATSAVKVRLYISLLFYVDHQDCYFYEEEGKGLDMFI